MSTVYPFGDGEHTGSGKMWCEWCEMDCTDLDTGELLCTCCRVDFLERRVEELEERLAEATTCPMCDEGYPPHVCASYADLVTQVRTLTNFREGVRYVHQVHWAPKTPPDDELLEWVRRDHVQAAIAQRLNNDVRAFQQCDGFEVFLAPDGENGLRECRKPRWHKEDE